MGAGEEVVEEDLSAGDWLAGPKREITAPTPVGTLRKLLRVLRNCEAFVPMVGGRSFTLSGQSLIVQFPGPDRGTPDVVPAISALGSTEVLSDLGVPNFLRDPAFLPDELPFGLGRLSVGPVDIAPTIWYSALDPLPALAQRAGRVSRKIIEFAAGRLAGLSRHDARNWRRLLRDFFVRTFARIGRATTSSPPTPNDTGDLLPLRSALTPTAPPAAAA